MSKWVAWFSKFTIFFIFFELTSLGLFSYSVDPKTRRAVESRTKVAICILGGIVSFGLFLFVAVNLLNDPSLAFFYTGIAYYTIILRNVFSFLMIISFYAFQVARRKYLVEQLNDLNVAYASFGLFYNAQSNAEFYHVYVPVFWKGIVCHVLVVYVKILMGYFMFVNFPGANLFYLIFYLVFPYIIQSATSSYMLLGFRKSSYLYVAMVRKLKTIHEEVQRLAKDEKVTKFAKMRRFCELSDEVDSLAISFDKITRMALDLSETYNIHMLLILGYSVSNNLTLFYQQYMGLIGTVLHYRVLATEIIFILINVVEILLVIGAVEEAERLFRKVLREVHLINYWQKFFDCRLKQSLETFSHMAAGQSFNITVFKMEKLNMSLGLSIFDATFNYFLILVQFDMAFKRGL